MSTPAYAIAHTILPNLIKLKTIQVLVGAIERKDKSMFQQVWTAVAHDPELFAHTRDPWQIGVVTLPKPGQMGEAYMAAFVAKKGDTAVGRYFLLEHTYVLAKKADETVLVERDQNRFVNIGPGPKPSGTIATDVGAFVDAIMEVLQPTRVVTRK